MRIGADDRPRRRRRQIGLADVAASTCGLSDIGPVIHDQRHAQGL